MMKTAVCVLLLIILPCVAWADTLSDVEAYRIIKKQVLVPCFDHTFEHLETHKKEKLKVGKFLLFQLMEDGLEKMEGGLLREIMDTLKNVPAEEREQLLELHLVSCKERMGAAQAKSLSENESLRTEADSDLSELDVLLLIRDRVVKPCLNTLDTILPLPDIPTSDTAISEYKILVPMMHQMRQRKLMQSISDQTIKQIQDVPSHQRDALLKEMMERCAVEEMRRGPNREGLF